MPDLPAGTVTFLFTDIEGSTELIHRLGDDRYAELLDAHRTRVRDAVAGEGGVVVDSSGDAFFVAFSSATAAARAALRVQRTIAAHRWPMGLLPRVRIGLHTGEPVAAPGGYVGIDVHRAARLCSAGYGGQILLSETTRGLLRLDQIPGAMLKELGVHRLKDLQRSEPISQLTAAEQPCDFPPLRTLTTAPNNLPMQLTTFVDRQREMDEIKTVLERSRIVTLTGPAGSGKTRLALQTAAEMVERFPDGVWLVELDALTERAQLAPAVAGVLRVAEEPARPLERVIEAALRPKTTLLILDNCEHLVEGCAHLAVALTRTCPHLRILATSRQALRAMGEATYPVVSLPLPRMSPPSTLEELMRNDAVALFVTRAQLTRPDFTLTEETAAAVARLVHRLEGIPLAIELAAARTRVLAVTEIAARLDQRLQLIIDGRPVAGSRRLTLRGAFDWSYDLLAPDERLLFRRLSVFSGLVRLASAEAVCADDRIPPGKVLDLVEGLVDKSLLLPDRPGELSGFRMLEILREYGAEKLDESGEAETLRDRHLSFFNDLASAAAARLHGPGQRVALADLSLEHDNFRAALRWALDGGRLEQGLRLAGKLWWFWYLRGHWTEAMHWLETLLGGGGPEPAEAIEPFTGSAYLAWRQGRYAEAASRAEQALRLSRAFESRPGEAHALLILGLLARRRGDFAGAVASHDRSLQAFRALGDDWQTARSLGLLAIPLTYLGEYDRALALFEESRATFRRMEDAHGQAYACHGLARVSVHAGRCDQAVALLRDAERLYRSLDDLEGLAAVQHTGGLAAICQGDYARAVTLLEASLAHFRRSGDEWSTRDALNALAVALIRLGDHAGAAARVIEGLPVASKGDPVWDRPGLAEGLEALAAVEAARGHHRVAARRLGTAGQLREEMRAPVPLYLRAGSDTLAAALRHSLSPADFEAELAAGRAVPADRIVEELRSSGYA